LLQRTQLYGQNRPSLMGSGCPYCAGKMPIVGEKDLVTCFPTLTTEWDYVKNGNLLPEQFLTKSNKRVWWKCSRCGKSWQASIVSRTDKETGCPDCARAIRGQKKVENLVAKNGSFGDKYPEIAKEWDYKKNGDLTPERVTYGSKKEVWWICSVCGHEWKKAVSARTGGCDCPVCMGKTLKPGWNDLATRNGGLLKDWDWDANGELTPSMVMPGSNQRIWWKCSECGYEWQTPAYSRTGQGTGCPKCANRVIVAGDNDFATKYPEHAAEWHPEKNGALKPQDVAPKSNKIVWWLCPTCGHDWEASVSDRASGRGCPRCVNERFTSFPEQALMYYLSKSTKAENKKRVQGKEIDVFLSELGVGIEYNGHYYHRNKGKTDQEKVAFFQKNGIEIITISEEESAEAENGKILYKYQDGYANFESIIRQIFDLLSLPEPDICIERDRQKIMSQYIFSEKENSIAARYPELVQEWNTVRNEGILPQMITCGSHKKVWWKCAACGFEWETRAYARRRSGCPNCRKEASKKTKE